MGIRFYPPCEALRGIVARIYAHESGPSTPSDPQWLIVPDGDIKLILPLAGDIGCAIGPTERRHAASRLILSGMRTEPGRLSFPSGVHAIGVIVRPEAAYRLIGVPHAQITNRTLDGEEIFDARARRLQNELLELRTEADRVSRLQMRLCEWLRDRRDQAFEHAVRRLRQREGCIRIETVAREVGWSVRQLERKFLEHAGVGPKELANVLRFNAVYKRMRGVATGRYGPLVHTHYFDQAHFLKAFKRYTGMAPRVFAAAPDYGRVYIPD